MAHEKKFEWFTETLDFAQLVFQQIQRVLKMPTDEEYNKEVDKLEDLLFAYLDEDYNRAWERKDAKQVMDAMSEPNYDKGLNVIFAKLKFRYLMELINRSGFTPSKIVEGVIDENTVCEIARQIRPSGDMGELDKEPGQKT